MGGFFNGVTDHDQAGSGIGRYRFSDGPPGEPVSLLARAELLTPCGRMDSAT